MASTVGYPERATYSLEIEGLVSHIHKLEAKVAEARELLQAGMRFAWNCEGDPQQPAAFRSRAEVWMADVQYLIGKE